MSSSVPTSNLLSKSFNPYLKQHENNPIYWQSWSPSIFTQSKSLNRPIFISIGYATCHWCHVMARESFSSSEVAEKLNRHFISVKVDREEHPEVDSFYMNSAHLMGVSGGWPLNIFTDDDGKPFFAGTYFPLQVSSYQRHQISFPELLDSVVHFWNKDKVKVLSSSEKNYQMLKEHFKHPLKKNTLTKDDLEFFSEDKEFKELHQKYEDSVYGGFKFQAQIKFPQLMNLNHLLRIYRREKDERVLEQVIFSVESMRKGGIYDHLGGGLCRYSTDYRWRVPHFEKMLYDNALFLNLLGDIYWITREKKYRVWAEEIVYYYERDMKSGSVFYSAEDADSEGEEGKFYLWSWEEVRELFKDCENTFEVLRLYFDLSTESNKSKGGLNGRNVLRIAKSEEEISHLLSLPLSEVVLMVKEGKKKMFQVRKKRIRPFKDQKIVTAWNGLMIISYARLGRIFKIKEWVDLSEKALDFFYQFKTDTALSRTYIYQGSDLGWVGSNKAQLSDFASLILAGLEVYRSTLDRRWLHGAYELTQEVMSHFESDGLFSEISKNHGFLLDFMVDAHDGVEPSGNSMMSLALLKLDFFFPEEGFRKKAEMIFSSFSGSDSSPLSGVSLPFMLSALHQLKRGFIQIQVVISKDLLSLLQVTVDKLDPDWLVEVVVTNKTRNQKISIKICLRESCRFLELDQDKIDSLAEMLSEIVESF